MTRPPVLSIVSKKRSGKTTLLTRLIPELKKRGYRVGTIKHDTHGFDIDHEGKDTWKHKQAGADTVAISSPWKISLIKDVARELTIDQLVERHFMDVDLVLTEGYMRAGKPRIEVFRSDAHEAPLHFKGEVSPLIGVVSDVAIDLGVPRFDINDIDELVDFVEAGIKRKQF